MQNIVLSTGQKAYLLFLVLTGVMLLNGLVFIDGGYLELYSLQNKLIAQESEVLEMGSRNARMYQKIVVLKSSPLAIESQARVELGMVKPKETYFQVAMPVDDAKVSR